MERRFQQDVEEPILARTWFIDCVELSLTQNCADSPIQLQGKGYLRQSSSGEVDFALYLSDSAQPIPLTRSVPNGIAGQLLGAENYYTFSATDWYGRVWKCRRILPKVATTFCASVVSQVVTGTAYELTCEQVSPYSNDCYYLRIVFLASIDLVATVCTEVTTAVGGKESLSSCLNTAIVESEYGQIRFTAEGGRVVATCEGAIAPPANFAARLTESLSFIVGRRCYWAYFEEHRLGNKKTVLRPQDQCDSKAALLPAGRHLQCSSETTWALFLRYLRFLLENQVDLLHPVSQQLYPVYQSRQGTIHAQALAMGVSVEGLCNSLFLEADEDKANKKAWLRELRKYCEAWDGFKDPLIRDTLFKRFTGLFSSLYKVGARGALLKLVDRKVISDDLVPRWVELRNAAAHASAGVGETLQDTVKLCDSVMVLIYQLVFWAVQYQGEYVDYSEYGHPIRHYPPEQSDTKPTES